MMKVKSWQIAFKHLKQKHPGNNIDKQNITPIETYNAIEGNARLDRKYPKLKGMYVMRRGERV